MEELRSTPALDGDDQIQPENVEEAAERSAEEMETVPAEEAQVEDVSETTGYDEAWDRIDLNDETSLGEFFSEDGATTEPEPEPEPEHVEEDGEPESEPSAPKGLVIENPVLKYKGKEIPVDSADELIKLAQKGLKLEIEMSKIKPQKRLIKLIEDAGIGEEELRALADAISGKKEALDYIAKKAGIELSGGSDDIFEEEPRKGEEYKPKVESVDPVRTYWDTLVEEDKQLASRVAATFDELDDSFRQELWNPKLFPGFVDDVKSGAFEEIYPVSVKLKAMNPAMTWLQAYATAVQQLAQSSGREPAKTKEPPAETRVPKATVRDKKPVREKEIEDRVWNDPDYEKELLNKLFA